MKDQGVPLSFLLLVTNIALVLTFALFASPAHAQVVDAAGHAADQLLEKGVLGTLCVIEGIVIFMLFREIRNGHAAAAEVAALTLKQQTEWAVKATEVLSRVNDHLEQARTTHSHQRRFDGVPPTGP